jgi:hypothetical protein
MRHATASALLIAFTTISVVAQSSQRKPRPATSVEERTPQVIIAPQPDSPLSVTTSTRWSTPGREIFDLYIVVKNVDGRAVRSYTTRVDSGAGEFRKEQCFIQNIYVPGKVLQTEQTDGKSRFMGIEKGAPYTAFQVSVDYLEFTDGSVWGVDSCQSAEYLAGERAGGQAAIDAIQKMLRERGPDAVVAAIKEGSVSVEEQPGRTSRWEEGFRQGIATINQRILATYQNEGLSEIEAALRKPYDASIGAK